MERVSLAKSQENLKLLVVFLCLAWDKNRLGRFTRSTERARAAATVSLNNLPTS